MKRFLLVLALAVFVSTGTAFAFDGGDGSPGDPYQISTCVQLQEVGFVDNLASSFILTQNIDCTASAGYASDPDNSFGFSPIGSQGFPFTGTFDGDGFYIDALAIRNYSAYVGLFAQTNGATITDVGLRAADIRLSGIPAAGILIGEATDTEISGSYASGSLNDNAPTTFHISRVVDGVAHEEYAEGFPVRYTTKQFDFSGLSDILTLEVVQTGSRPFAGIDAMTVEACGSPLPFASAYSTADGADLSADVATVDLNVIGVHERSVRATWALPDDCSTATLSLTANEYGQGVPFKYPRAGSVSYEMNSQLGSPVTDGFVFEYDHAAALFTPHWSPATGHPSGDVPVFVTNDDEYLYVAADVTIDNTNDVGEDWISITVGDKTFKVTDDDATYGVCGFGLTDRVTYKHNTCELRIPRSELPAGEYISITLGYYGTAAESFWGGLVGLLTGTSTIEQSYAHITIETDDTGTFARVGGLVGQADSLTSITDTYARGALDHEDFSGNSAGLVSRADGSITNSYAAVTMVDGVAPSERGLTGSGATVAISSYWDTDVSGLLVSVTGTGKTTAEMQDFETYVGWDFDAIWDIEDTTNGGYPFFGNAPAPTPTPAPSSSGHSSGGIMAGSLLWYQLGYGSTPTPTPTPGNNGLIEGDVIRATGDGDIYIVNSKGFKRLFLNPVIFNFYAHLGWDKVKEVSVSIRDSFGTSGLFRNCETDDQKVYALEVTGEDTGFLYWVDVTGDAAVQQDPEFFHKVFCINNNEFNWYPKSPTPYTKLSDLPKYSR